MFLSWNFRVSPQIFFGQNLQLILEVFRVVLKFFKVSFGGMLNSVFSPTDFVPVVDYSYDARYLLFMPGRIVDLGQLFRKDRLFLLSC